MPDKFKNIFWHQGVKFFVPEDEKQDRGLLLKVDHLENDVTKCFLNIFEHTDRKVFDEFIAALNKRNKNALEDKKQLFFDWDISFAFQI